MDESPGQAAVDMLGLDAGPLTLGQFRDATEGMPDELMIVLQRDAEGNEFLPVGGVEWDQAGAYFPREKRFLDGEDREYVAREERGATDSEEDHLGPGVPALVLWPGEHFTEDDVTVLRHPTVPVPPFAAPRVQWADGGGEVTDGEEAPTEEEIRAYEEREQAFREQVGVVPDGAIVDVHTRGPHTVGRLACLCGYATEEKEPWNLGNRREAIREFEGHDCKGAPPITC